MAGTGEIVSNPYGGSVSVRGPPTILGQVSQITASSVPSGKVPNFGPLTTTFTPPASCSSIAWVDGAAFDATLFYAPFKDCYPGTAFFSYFWDPDYYSHVDIFWSPGTVCPSGYTSYPLSSNDTSIQGLACCPKGFDRTGDYGCSRVRASSNYPYVSYSGTARVKTGTVYRTDTIEWAYALTLSAPATQSSTFSSATSSAANSSLATSLSDSKATSNSLTTGAKAGIVISVMFFVALLAVLGFLLVKILSKRAIKQHQPENGPEIFEYKPRAFYEQDMSQSYISEERSTAVELPTIYSPPGSRTTFALGTPDIPCELAVTKRQSYAKSPSPAPRSRWSFIPSAALAGEDVSARSTPRPTPSVATSITYAASIDNGPDSSISRAGSTKFKGEFDGLERLDVALRKRLEALDERIEITPFEELLQEREEIKQALNRK